MRYDAGYLPESRTFTISMTFEEDEGSQGQIGKFISLVQLLCPEEVAADILHELMEAVGRETP